LNINRTNPKKEKRKKKKLHVFVRTGITVEEEVGGATVIGEFDIEIGEEGSVALVEGDGGEVETRGGGRGRGEAEEREEEEEEEEINASN